MQSVLWRWSGRDRGGGVICTCTEPGRVAWEGRGHGRVVVSLKDQGVSSVIRWHCAAVFLANFWVFWALFPLSMNPLEPSGAPERSSRAEHCGVSRENLMKVLLVALHSRHFQEFLGDLCDHFICHKKGGFESRMLSFHENNIKTL